MRLVCGLGNPGQEYEGTPHNAGFLALDKFAERLKLGPWKLGHQGLLIKDNLEGSPFVLLKPQTFMNRSGQSLSACARFFKVELADILVVSDDLDLETGRLRYRQKGGHGGHNGLKDIIAHLGGDGFERLRIGIGRPQKGNVTGHVLGKAKGESKELLELAANEAAEQIKNFIGHKPVHIESKTLEAPCP
ncbi:MAG: aminoacyl-tRNA hydrolase [Candidatus Lambdaproteobacteria bacterium RIFOXYD2_FULL_50_16]|uniref:Peptidyl-tRNA hydrolase n=1 Tax=Candidatus Lambdaproteobacteria bacterium RIFOXYD2_FULL_50_16 TaxID=1817772 RepID=A0A1F6G9T5_9PROT|nr:MAG: aminoacyl-tRNA hydrolase [Candidatus Lambdaproteobacteria bacterium RIFOXYD2_FULL_50_16]